ncbi:MAG: hypothetical protein A3B30_01090 [Candidatus Komeilibacteria bacterium RIFCSPLOWO2_01_FULL_52_15]|uniref:Methyltransferase domain-containing protein n=2 Tax=Candidatus Komeiliibacteriota TaxID=1817908 RepID=A0A1G2BUC8_9BACT|nr:MAG: hypothetical protein A2677_01570 [Candidatus Komeilibacteria bacterium RIFCSPHIGHO2_01_FULL_52_14]OGY91857.1 MAG: hypothetical protein A3B30_01090 [Candidatus Komeilibacteria bacterium RIFCSPLOWO2_01_FULL_52_15]
MIEAIGAGIVLIVAITSIIALHSFAPWIPAKTALIKTALSSLKPSKNLKFVDLGCGDGRIVFLAACHFGLQAHGWERAPLPYALARIRSLAYSRCAAHIHYGDLFSVDLSQFDIIYFYGLPETVNIALYAKMRKEVKPGTTIMSYNFSIKNVSPLAVFTEKWRSVYIYRWQSSSG